MKGSKHIAALLATTIAMTVGAAVAPKAEAKSVNAKSCSAVARAWPKKQRASFLRTCKARVAKHNAAVRCKSNHLTPFESIECIWPKALRAQAKRVASCESTAHVSNAVAKRNRLGRWAQNGQYLGVFQMGTHERATYGNYTTGSPARLQVASAYKLYRQRGWQPWSCKP